METHSPDGGLEKELKVFRRRRSEDEEPDEAFNDDTADLDTADDDGADRGADRGAEQPSASARPDGPYDDADAPDDGLARIDLGALQVTVPEGIEVRVDVQDQTVVAATLVDGHSAIQVHAFAAPRSNGIWAEVRTEIAQSLEEAGGTAQEAEGPFGAELHARVPSAPVDQSAPAQPTGLQPMRFIGVDGPRWFLRGLLTGPAATDPNQARRLLDAFRQTVVVRGADAMAPRDMLPLKLPKEALDHLPEPEPPARPGLEMLERGPEITETR